MVARHANVEANRGFECSYDRLVQRTLEPGPLARFIARVLPGWLDRALIAGCDPVGSPHLAVRAATLTGSRSRAAIGEGLERLLETAQGTRRRRMVLRRGGHVMANASALRELAAVLRGSAPLYARGIAIANQLLTDGTGPAYVGGGEALARSLLEARAAMYGLDATGVGPARSCHAPRREPNLARRLATPEDRVVKRLGPSYRLPGGSWIYRRHDSS
jgi:hypothetical protein